MKKIVIIGGGASGMACAVMLAHEGASVTILERGERLGRKLSSTGNGQGNVSNSNMGKEHYFSDDLTKVERALSRFSERETVAFLESMGGIFLPDDRGRIYPAGRQASAVTDLFRRELAKSNVQICLNTQVTGITQNESDGSFFVEWDGGRMRADAVVLAAGGKAAPSFGTDGKAYEIAKMLGHSVTELTPSLVQLKCDPALVRGLKGIRSESHLTLERNGNVIFKVRGDVLFTEYGISGDAVFRASAYAKEGDIVFLDFVPDAEIERVQSVVSRCGLYCVVPNGLARVLEKLADDSETVAKFVKRFPVRITGNNGFWNAQVTKGGIPLSEVDDNFMSKFHKGLYFTGEVLNVDGECGGYNLQWAFTSAYCVAEAIACS